MNNLIDIRTKKEYNEFSLSNSTNIPRINLLSEPEKYLCKNKTYNLICERGTISASCSRILNALGYNCKSVDGGLEAYKKRNDKLKD